jgi:hypothetical protein
MEIFQNWWLVMVAQFCDCIKSVKLYYFLAALEFVFVVLHLLGTCSLYHLSHTFSSALLSLFCFGYLSDRVSCFRPGRPGLWSTLPVASHIPGTTGVYHQARLIGWDGVSLTFCWGWPQTAILLISASRVSEISGMSHHTWLNYTF